MSEKKITPGPIAERTFELGLKIGAAGGIAAAATLFLVGPASISNGIHVVLTLLLYPVYLLTVATLLGIWLGYDTDARNLERVTEERAGVEVE
jgi:hypothetical protein